MFRRKTPQEITKEKTGGGDKGESNPPSVREEKG